MSKYVAFLKPLLALVLIWEMIVQLSLVPDHFLPHTYEVFEASITYTLNGEVLYAAWLTMTRALTALAFAILIGVPIGLMMGQFRLVEWFFDPIISIGFPIPKITFVPVFLLWFGFGSFPKILLAASDAIFPIIISTYAGTKAVNKELVWSARSMGLTRVETMRKIIMPSALPEIFNGIQVALPLSFIIVIVAEMITGGGGLGEMLIRSSRFFETARMFVALTGIALLGLIFDRILRTVRRQFLHWN